MTDAARVAPPRAILIAHANDTEAQRLAELMQRLDGANVCTRVGTGMAALETLKRMSCDLIVLEAVRDNEEALTKLRLDPKLGDAPIVMIAMQGAEDRRVRAYELGAADFIQTPSTQSASSDEDLLHRVRQALELYAARRHLREAELEFTSLRATDAVTGLGNFQRLHAVIDYEFGRAVRYQRSLSCAMIADDAIDAMVSEKGRAEADARLANIAKIIRAEMRNIDRVFRIDVSEFVMVFPETSSAGAKIALDRILKHLSADGVAGDQAHKPLLYASVVSVPHSEIKRSEDLFRAANIALELARKLKQEPWPLVEFQRFV